MSLSLTGVSQAAAAGPAQPAKGAPDQGAGAVKAPASYGSGPAAVLTVSAQAKAAAAKALAIKNGHDPDGVQDGK